MVMPNENTQKAWIALMRAQKNVHEFVEGRLKAEKLPPLQWYDLLWELERSKECGVRAFELQTRLLLPQYGMSRLAAKLEAEGLIWRGECPEDGRGLVLAITDKGREMRKKIWSIYGPAMQEVFGEKFTPDEIKQLNRQLGKLQP